MEQADRRLIARFVQNALEQSRSEPSRPKQLAFHAQEGEFVDRIDQAQLRVEFQTVENDDLRREAYMFGPQVAVAVDKTMTGGAGLEQRPMLAQIELRRLRRWWLGYIGYFVS